MHLHSPLGASDRRQDSLAGSHEEIPRSADLRRRRPPSISAVPRPARKGSAGTASMAPAGRSRYRAERGHATHELQFRRMMTAPIPERPSGRVHWPPGNGFRDPPGKVPRGRPPWPPPDDHRLDRARTANCMNFDFSKELESYNFPENTGCRSLHKIGCTTRSCAHKNTNHGG